MDDQDGVVAGAYCNRQISYHMRKFCWVVCLWCCWNAATAQPVREKLRAAVEKLQNDSQMKHAILGLSVWNSLTGEKVIEVNAQTGLAPASVQKTITSAAALEMLGPDYRYQTILGYDGSIEKGTLHGNLYIIGGGDPSLGSWRFDSTGGEQVLNGWLHVLRQNNILRITGDIIGHNGKWEGETLPGGWIWDDIGNYYGAGSSALNWHENQYDLILRSGNTIGDSVVITGTKPRLFGIQLESKLVSAAKGSGDNAYIYLPPLAERGVVRGTIPVDEKAFTISGSFPDPSRQLLAALHQKLDSVAASPARHWVSWARELPTLKTLQAYRSPALDSLNYFFMKRSINLYGEVFLKTIAYEKTGYGAMDKGLELVREFWKDRGIEPAALRMSDGSGLSPQNRVTADALVKVLQYARGRPWFRYYYDALPVFNQMKLKSGTIGGAKSFAGYHTAKDGTTYTVAIIVNNYDGSASGIVKKMYSLLDELK